MHKWAIKWGVSMAALQDLQALFGLNGSAVESAPVVTVGREGSEAAVQAAVRLEAARAGLRLWRNNVGALKDERGVPIRYGLANDTAQLNKSIKSGDLIGARSVVVTPNMLGRTVAVFTSRECKPAGWSFSGTERETAQLRWIELVNGLGGDASFVTGPGSFAQC